MASSQYPKSYTVSPVKEDCTYLKEKFLSKHPPSFSHFKETWEELSFHCMFKYALKLFTQICFKIAHPYCHSNHISFLQYSSIIISFSISPLADLSLNEISDVE